MKRLILWAFAGFLAAVPFVARAGTPEPPAPLFHDSHLHLTNFVQQGTDIRDFVKIMGAKVGRAAVFGLPLQQMWSYGNTGDFAPTYYLQTDAPLYYYSFTDAFIAMAYRSLPPEEKARIDPMITGFNPADMYAVDHIKRVLTTFPGVFSGIGEFSIHKEFVSAKIAKYVVASPEAIRATAEVVNRHPDRFLFGTDEVAPSDTAKYLKVYEMYAPFWAALTPKAREKVLKGNYERLFAAARVRVRAWEKTNVK
jgi:hypothetical protein